MVSIKSFNRALTIKSDLTFINTKFPFLLFDRRRLQQVLLNLLMNALKFQTDGEIIVSAEVLCKSRNDAEYLLRIGVEDQGIGMTQKELSNVLKAFDGVGHFKSKDKNPYGNGVGLAICDQICKSLGGNISVKSQSGMGTTFKFTMKVLNDSSSANRPMLAIEESPVQLLQPFIDGRKSYRSNNSKKQDSITNPISSIRRKSSNEWGDVDDERLLEAIDEENEIVFNGVVFDLSADRTQPKPSRFTSKQP